MNEIKAFSMEGWVHVDNCRCRRSDDNFMTGKLYRNDVLDYTFKECWMCNDEIYGTGIYNNYVSGECKRLNGKKAERVQEAQDKKEIKKRTMERKLHRD